MIDEKIHNFTIGEKISSDDMTEQEQINILGFIVPKSVKDPTIMEVLSVDMENKIVTVGEE